MAFGASPNDSVCAAESNGMPCYTQAQDFAELFVRPALNPGGTFYGMVTSAATAFDQALTAISEYEGANMQLSEVCSPSLAGISIFNTYGIEGYVTPPPPPAPAPAPAPTFGFKTSSDPPKAGPTMPDGWYLECNLEKWKV